MIIEVKNDKVLSREDLFLEKIERIKMELSDWLHYRERAQTDAQFGNVAQQELQHALLMMTDMLADLNTLCTAQEQQELHNVLRQIGQATPV